VVLRYYVRKATKVVKNGKGGQRVWVLRERLKKKFFGIVYWVRTADS
jgi:hypothetical protein